MPARPTPRQIAGTLLASLVLLALFISQHHLPSRTPPPLPHAALHHPGPGGNILDPFTRLTEDLRSYPPSPRPSILILQHIPYLNPLHGASSSTHELYARIHGYGYRSVEGEHNTQDGRKFARQMNKMYALRDVLREEVGKGESGQVEWILFTDIDTVISNPAIPLHLLLPPSNLTPEPHILGNQDHNGLNAGVLLLRASPLILELVEWCLLTFESTPDKGDGWAPSDQILLGRRLLDDPELASHFYEIPQRWLNAYFLEPEDEWAPPQLQVHFVNRLKFKYAFMPVVKALSEVLVRGREAAERAGKGGTGLELLPDVEKAERAGREWWAQAKSGVKDMRFLFD
ncbi:hypothetical protein IAT38_003537 [Cryptococcus sp. DSM 104549]